MNLTEFISKHIPKKQTNILYTLFNNTKNALQYMITKLDIMKRERNILTATSLISLRNLAAQNGFEPTLKVPSRGLLLLKVNQQLFNKNGYPLFITPGTVFRNKLNKIEYYYSGTELLRITNEPMIIPVIEGILEKSSILCKGETLETIYLKTDAVAEDSINITSNKGKYTEVKSFYDNINEYDNRQFIVKFSSNLEYPIVIYVKGTTTDETLNIEYRVCNGEYGNIDTVQDFEITQMYTIDGEDVELLDSEISITNYNGFDFGSNGTTSNALKASIGYNHGSNLLFDNQSYNKFLRKFSNILIQDIKINENNRSINFIYISKLHNLEGINDLSIRQVYVNSIQNLEYQFSNQELKNLSNLLEKNEYALSSHNLFHSKTQRFALQIKFKTIKDLDKESVNLEQIIYREFSRFLYKKHHIINIDKLFSDFMESKKISFDYTLFDEFSKTKSENKIISHKEYLPILNGNFKIYDSNNKEFDLFEDINFVV